MAQYHDKIEEIIQINNLLGNMRDTTKSAAGAPLFPLESYIFPDDNIDSPYPPALAPPRGQTFQQCDMAGGVMQLPPSATLYPDWLKDRMRDGLADFCFQMKVVFPGGLGPNVIDSLQELGLADKIGDKVSLRVTWFLPFFYGLLGASLFVMRNVANVRTPTSRWFPVMMRITLGGIAGIVIGWFATPGSAAVLANQLLTVPFALAFLTGYGIDLLFTALDRLNKLIATATPVHTRPTS